MFLKLSFVLIFKTLRCVCRLAKRFATQFFIANNLLYNSLNTLIGSLGGYITHLIFLHHLHQPQLLCTSKKQDNLFSCTRLNSVLTATSSVTL